MRKALLDTNVIIDWLNQGLRESVVVGPGLVRYLSATVAMELYAGAHTGRGRRAIDAVVKAHREGGRMVAPSNDDFLRAGSVLRQLKLAGREVRSASLVADVLIAQTARTLGATVVTAHRDDFEAIARVMPFLIEVV
jgi:predicted nucleic acid-binding protein